jgi:hypothetical protein
MIAIIQQVLVEAGKEMRGAGGAQIRSQIARGYPIPNDMRTSPAETFKLHRLIFTELNSFTSPVKETLSYEIWTRPNFAVVGCVAISHRDEQLAVGYVWSREEGGAPKRLDSLPSEADEIPVGGEAFALDPGQWGCIVYNGKTTGASTGKWYYRYVTVNVAWGEKSSEDLFTRCGEPAHTYKNLRSLW